MDELDHYGAAEASASLLARRLLRQGTPPDIIADAFLSAGLAPWAAATEGNRAARHIISVWVLLRNFADARV